MGEGRDVRGRHRAQFGQRRGMPPGAAQPGGVLVERLPDERVGEAHPARSGFAEEAGQHGGLETVEDLVLGVARHADQ